MILKKKVKYICKSNAIFKFKFFEYMFFLKKSTDNIFLNLFFTILFLILELINCIDKRFMLIFI
jgi:hypothetical protein